MEFRGKRLKGGFKSVENHYENNVLRRGKRASRKPWKTLQNIVFCEGAKRVAKKLINPVEFHEIPRQKAKKVLKIGGKPLLKQCFAERETHVREIMKTPGNNGVCPHGKSVVKYLVKPVEFIEIERENAEKVRKIVGKPLGKQRFAEGATRNPKIMKNVVKQCVLRTRKTSCKIPYKTCGIQSNLKPKTAKGVWNQWRPLVI